MVWSLFNCLIALSGKLNKLSLVLSNWCGTLEFSDTAVSKWQNMPKMHSRKVCPTFFPCIFHLITKNIAYKYFRYKSPLKRQKCALNRHQILNVFGQHDGDGGCWMLHWFFQTFSYHSLNPSFLLAGWNFLSNFQKGGSLQISIFRGVLLGKWGWPFSWGWLEFLIKKKRKIWNI